MIHCSGVSNSNPWIMIIKEPVNTWQIRAFYTRFKTYLIREIWKVLVMMLFKIFLQKCLVKLHQGKNKKDFSNCWHFAEKSRIPLNYSIKGAHILYTNLRLINSNGKIQKILAWMRNFNLIISHYLEVALFHDLHKESKKLPIT